MATLAEEIKQNIPFPKAEQEVFLNLQKTAYESRQAVEKVLREHDLTQQQYNVLRILRGTSEGLACSLISERLVFRDSDITRLLNRLEKRGLIEVRKCDEDRRVKRSRITEEGLALLAELDEPVLDVTVAQFEHLGESMLQQLNALLVLARSK